MGAEYDLLKLLLERLLISTTEDDPNVRQMYPLLATMGITEEERDEFKGNSLPGIYTLFRRNVLRKVLVFLSLLVNRDGGVLKEFVEYEMNLQMDLKNSTSLFVRTYKFKRYWLEEILRNKCDLAGFNDDLKMNIRIAQLLTITNNQQVVDLERIREILSEDLDHKDDFVSVYVNEIKYILGVIDFIQDNDTATMESFNYINSNSMLRVFNEYLDMSDESKWTLILEKLHGDEDRRSKYEYNSEQAVSHTEAEVFKGFTLIHSVICCIKSFPGGTSEAMGRNEAAFNMLNNEGLQVEILECIFALCFIQGVPDSFLCSEKELQMILAFVKTCTDKFRLTSNPRLKLLNRYISDALWRLEMVTNVKQIGDGKQFLSYMLADPESLITMCLKQQRFDKALQVIQIFNLEETELANNIIYTERLSNLRASLTKAFKIKEYQKNIPQNSSQIARTSSQQIISDFFDSAQNSDEGENHANPALPRKFCDILDVALVSTCSLENSKELLDAAEQYLDCDKCTEEYRNFHKRLKELSCKIPVPITEILLNPTYELSYEKHRSKENLYSELQSTLRLFSDNLKPKPPGLLTSKHPAHNTFMKLNVLLGEGCPKYLLRLYNYLKSLLKLFQIEGNHTDLISRGRTVSYFEILNQGRGEIFRKLIFDRGLDPQDLSDVCNKLKIDCLYYTASNCFPKIELQNPEVVSAMERPSKSVFSYILKRNWLLAYIIKEIFGIENPNMDISENRTKYFVQYINSNNINRLKILFNNNKIITSLHNDYISHCLEYMNKNLFHEQEGKFDDSFETATEIIEGDYSCNWRYLLELVDSIPERQVLDNKRIERMKDRILSNLVLDSYESDHYKYVQFIKDDELRLGLILEHFSGWPGEFCVILLNMELARDEVSCRTTLEDWLKVVAFCEEVVQLFDFKIWSDVHEQSCGSQEEIMSKLLSKPKVDLLLNFIDLYKCEALLKSSITPECIYKILRNNECFDGVEKLLENLPEGTIIEISKNLLLTLRNIDQVQFLINYLGKISHEDAAFLKNIQLSVDMLQLFTTNERDQLWCLIDKPINIVEMLVMNTKLDKLGVIMEKLRPNLETCELYDDEISVENVDELLRKYAEKSLEFRVIVQPHPKLLQGSDNKLMQSLDSLYGPDRKYFVMPPMVPDRTDWVPNNEVVECMCCQNTVFSMFNRRHHCRRCGRVICFNCSTRRMHVPTYGNILVRVCIDCYDQSHSDGNSSINSDNASLKSIMYDYWLLTDDEHQNIIVRQEFSYEHAPSVSLCLSIMKHHSKNMHYARFLLDQCDCMLKLLQPVAPNGPQEIDYSLVVKMMKSLAIAAKMLSAECYLQCGASQADRILSQADLLGLLAERGCLNLLGPASPNSTPYVDATVLRRLRDNLLEREQWNFALDVSTKAGLDNAGVFAAWGKSCLKAGCLQLAREKFHRCLDKSNHYDLIDYSLDDSYEGAHKKRYGSRTSSGLESKPQKNPPLLNQIVQILEAQTVKFDARTKKDLFNIRQKSQSSFGLHKALNSSTSSDPAICIKSKLKNLKAVALGNYDQAENLNNRLDPLFFEECIYYLGKYGTHSSLLQFYIRHDNLRDALNYMIDNRVTAEVFIEVYMVCLNEGKIDVLQDGMAAIDSTLDIWKEHLKQICRYLEKQGLLNSLYQLQQFMGDFVRAAMTCIRFYKDNVNTYKELLSNIHFLRKAEKHMKQELEQQQWVEVNTVRRMSSDSKSSCYEEKALTNPSLVMKMNSREVEKHIHTIRRQIEVTKFLAELEKEDKHFFNILPNITPSINEDVKERSVYHMPTLFDSQHEKVQLTVLIIICAEDICQGYQLAHLIIQEYKLKAIKVYCQAGRLLANESRYEAVAQLVSCICSSGVTDPTITDMCDELLAAAIRSTNDTPTPPVEALIKLISDKAMKITMFIETKQLKSAYLLAAKYNRFGDIRRILREAELINKPDIKKLCQKLLQAHSHSHKDL